MAAILFWNFPTISNSFAQQKHFILISVIKVFTWVIEVSGPIQKQACVMNRPERLIILREEKKTEIYTEESQGRKKI